MIEFVTSVSFPYFTKYGKRTARTFLKFVDPSITLKIYHEASAEEKDLADYRIPDSPRISTVDLHAETNMMQFLELLEKHAKKRCGPVSPDPDERFRGGQRYHYQWDAVTFGKKGLSFAHAARTSRAKFVIWVDADIVFRKRMSAATVTSLFSGRVDVIHFGRKTPHSETGFFGVRVSRRSRAFIEEYASFWEKKKVLAIKEGWTDSHVFDEALRICKKSLGLKTKSLSTVAVGHVIAASPLGAYMDHQKGPRKRLGYSPERT